jgi:hypothetical protein
VRSRLAAFALLLGGTLGTSYAVGARLADSPLRHGEHGVREITAEHDGYRLERVDAVGGSLTYRIVDADGAPVRRFDVVHEQRLHLLAIRPDLTGFQHLHPAIDDEGTIVVPDTFDRPTRLFFDARPAGGEPLVLGAEVTDGANVAPADTVTVAEGDIAVVDGIIVVRSGTTFTLRDFEGGPVGGLEPYLGAPGHLVVLRRSDLGFSHLHAEASTPPGTLRFPGSLAEGDYRWFVQFSRHGRVHTVAFDVSLDGVLDTQPANTDHGSDHDH